jgi:hypothetical protein
MRPRKDQCSMPVRITCGPPLQTEALQVGSGSVKYAIA